MDDLGILDLSFVKNKTGDVEASHSFTLLPTANASRDEEIDLIIKKWTDNIEGDAEGGDILCTVGKPASPCHSLCPIIILLHRKLVPIAVIFSSLLIFSLLVTAYSHLCLQATTICPR